MHDRRGATTRTREATTPPGPDDAGTITVGVRELRDHLSRYLAEATTGRSIAATEHGTVIGTIVPMRFSQPVIDLYREGKIELPTLPKRGADDFTPVAVEGGIQDIVRGAAAAEGLTVLPEVA
jgi:antitoxin (DNA-binding transcriptional repressor) of toxin-antitoxin stability system